MPTILVSCLSIVLGTVLILFARGDATASSMAVVMITAGVGVLGRGVYTVAEKQKRTDKKADDAMEATQTLRRDMLDKK